MKQTVVVILLAGLFLLGIVGFHDYMTPVVGGTCDNVYLGQQGRVYHCWPTHCREVPYLPPSRG